MHISIFHEQKPHLYNLYIIAPRSLLPKLPLSYLLLIPAHPNKNLKKSLRLKAHRIATAIFFPSTPHQNKYRSEDQVVKLYVTLAS